MKPHWRQMRVSAETGSRESRWVSSSKAVMKGDIVGPASGAEAPYIPGDVSLC